MSSKAKSLSWDTGRLFINITQISVSNPDQSESEGSWFGGITGSLVWKPKFKAKSLNIFSSYIFVNFVANEEPRQESRFRESLDVDRIGICNKQSKFGLNFWTCLLNFDIGIRNTDPGPQKSATSVDCGFIRTDKDLRERYRKQKGITTFSSDS